MVAREHSTPEYLSLYHLEVQQQGRCFVDTSLLENGICLGSVPHHACPPASVPDHCSFHCFIYGPS